MEVPLGTHSPIAAWAELSFATTASAPDQRRVDRISLILPAGIRRAGAAAVSVTVLDLSPTGFRVETHLLLPESGDVWLRLPGLEPRHARVIWSSGCVYGCAFEEPLHPAVFDMISRPYRHRELDSA